MSVILPWVGGFVDGGMVDGSIDKIAKKKKIILNLIKYTLLFFHL